jgi:hypothetical protein
MGETPQDRLPKLNVPVAALSLISVCKERAMPPPTEKPYEAQQVGTRCWERHRTKECVSLTETTEDENFVSDLAM